MSRRRMQCALLGAGVLASLAPVAVHAQRGIGDRIRRAAEQAAGRKAGEVAGTPADPRRYDAATIGTPFDAASLEATLRGLRAAAAQREASRALLRQASGTATEGVAGRERAEQRKARERIAECRWEWMSQAMHERVQQADRRLRAPSTPDAKIEAWENARMAHDSERLARFERADTAGGWALTRELLRKHGGTNVTEADDEAALAKACGAPPASGAGARADSLRERARELERSATDSAVRASGMTATRFALARERLLTYVSDAASRKPGLWSTEERRLLDGRRSEIEAALRGA